MKTSSPHPPILHWNVLSTAATLASWMTTKIAQQVQNASSKIFPLSSNSLNFHFTTKKAITAFSLAAAGLSLPQIDISLFINPIFSLLKSSSSTLLNVLSPLWNYVPTSTKLLLAAGVIYWGWRKWKGESLEKIQLQNHNKNKVIINFNHQTGISKIEQTKKKETDGTETTTYNIQFPPSDRPDKSNVLILTEEQFWSKFQEFSERDNSGPVISRSK